jgi:hypothetical protein
MNEPWGVWIDKDGRGEWWMYQGKVICLSELKAKEMAALNTVSFVGSTYTARPIMTEAKEPQVSWACLQCGVYPCECGKVIWGYWWKPANSPREWFREDAKCCTLADAVEWRRRRENIAPGQGVRGPVQRHTEPVPEFAAVGSSSNNTSGNNGGTGGAGSIELATTAGGSVLHLPRPGTPSPAKIFAALVATDETLTAEVDLRCEGDTTKRERVLAAMYLTTKPELRERAERIYKILGGLP